MSRDFTRRYDVGVQRYGELDLAFNGLLDQRTAADPRHAPTEDGFRSARDRISVLLGQADGRAFTDAEQVEWQSALGSAASYYAAEEDGRAR